jgi:hypothetical protein
MESLNVYGLFGLNIESLPFSLYDTTGGSETELQAVVLGKRSDVDLPTMIEQSHYFSNILRRARAGDTKKKVITDLEKYLNSNESQVWENSWVRFPRNLLHPFADEIFSHDLLTDKKNPSRGLRNDIHKFIVNNQGNDFIRIPISYLMKLSLADAIGPQESVHPIIYKTGRDLLGHFLNDNTSPETFSFQVIPLHPETGMGKAVARETAKRYLLTQLLIMYANEKFSLRSTGQTAMVFFSPHPPIHQKKLNDCISDSFYRELFMNPCLSGWDKGEEKHEYMHLCHRVLSRSQLNAVAKLKEAGIITSNLVVLPNTSNISLANNGIHVSLGSRKLSHYLADTSSGFTNAHEKYLGDLVIKIVEHFLPLFVGTYSAAPYRFDFTDFHPERVLGFLPHELDYTHLRMLWRRWQKKAKIHFLGRSITPFGPPYLDRTIQILLNLKGDFIPDFRLIDYLVALMSTEKSPALDGTLQNAVRLKKDLTDLGIFDSAMALYLLERMRSYDVMGFSGFEARHYSLFESLGNDLGNATNLQNLLYLLAFKYIARGDVTHSHIPDDPFVESERRQILFGTAIGIPTFFIRHDTANAFIKKIIMKTARVRPSARYPGYLRVYNTEYRRTLMEIISEDAADLIELLNMNNTISDLVERLDNPEEQSTLGRLKAAILRKAGVNSPFKMKSNDFNKTAEHFYREDLRKLHMKEAFRFLEEDVRNIDLISGERKQSIRKALHTFLKERTPLEYLRGVQRDVQEERVSLDSMRQLIFLLLITIYDDIHNSRELLDIIPETCLNKVPAYGM